MIITKEKSKRVVESHEFDSVNCTIDAEDMRYVASLLRNNYSNPSLAVVREITANALDANIEAGATRRVEVTVPTQLAPHFVVRDFGGGLSQEDVFGLYSKYGKSTKRSSNNYIGAFGIGKFAPLSYGNNFTVVSYHGGKKISYNVFVNEDDDTKIVKLHEEVSNEPTGLSVEVAIADDDVDTFRDVCKDFFRFFSDEEMPKFIGVGEDEKFFDDYEVIMEAHDGSWFILDDQRESWRRHHHQSHAIMGRVHYPLNASSINFDSITVKGDKKSQRTANQLKELVNQHNLYIRFDIGQLKLHHSRESLEYNKQTQKEILSVLLEVCKDIEEIAKEKLGDAEDLWDAKVKYAQVMNALPYGLKHIFENSFQWKGVKINTPTINRDYKWQDDVKVREYRKSNDADATDGYKVSSTETARIYPQKDSILVIQDLHTTYGNNLRARTLFNENEDAEVIYAVSWDTSEGKEYVYAEDGMGFSQINEERFIFFSDVEKAKLQSKGRAISGESRAEVPLFEFETDINSYSRVKNSSYWLNCNESVDELEGKLKDGEVHIYVPICNYKVVDEDGSNQESCMSLESLLRDVKGIARLQQSMHEKNGAVEDKGEFEPPVIYGIRRKDCKKLSDGYWMTWQDYKKDFCQSYLMDYKDEIIASEKSVAFKEKSGDLNYFHQIRNLFDNSHLGKLIKSKLPSNHLIASAYADYGFMGKEDDTLNTLYSLYRFMENTDPKWLKDNFALDYDISQFDEDCNEITTKYPLLVNLSNNIYSWQNMNENDLGKNIIDYIKLADGE